MLSRQSRYIINATSRLFSHSNNANKFISTDRISKFLIDHDSIVNKDNQRRRFTIMLSLSYPAISKNAFDYLASERDTLNRYAGFTNSNGSHLGTALIIDGHRKCFIDQMKNKYGDTQELPNLSDEQEKKVDQLSDQLSASEYHYPVNFIYLEHRDVLDQFKNLNREQGPQHRK